LVNGNYQKGTEFLEECLALKPSPIIRGMALHNLACGYWWDYCNVIEVEKVKTKEELQTATENAEVINDGDFQALMKRIEDKNRMIIPNLKNALKSFELLYGDDPVKYPRPEKNKLTPEEYDIISAITNETVTNMDVSKLKVEEINIKSMFCGLTAGYIGEMLYQINSVPEALFWIKLSLHLSVKTASMPRTLRSMVLLALINIEEKQFEFGEKLYLDCLEYMEGMKVYNKIVCLESYAFFLTSQKRNYEAEEYSRQAAYLRETIPEFYQRKEFLQIPDYQLK